MMLSPAPLFFCTCLYFGSFCEINCLTGDIICSYTVVVHSVPCGSRCVGVSISVIHDLIQMDLVFSALFRLIIGDRRIVVVMSVGLVLRHFSEFFRRIGSRRIPGRCG